MSRAATAAAAALVARDIAHRVTSHAFASSSTSLLSSSASSFVLGLTTASASIATTSAARSLRTARTAGARAAVRAFATRAMGKPSTPSPPPSYGVAHVVKVCHDLSKFRLSVFVTSTAACGYALASDGSIDLGGLAGTCVGTMLCSASANTLNQIIERVPDSLMRRTWARPLPSGRCTPAFAGAFAVASALGGVGVLRATTNDTTAALGAGNIFLYAGVYTPLKRVHFLNTWIGAVVGAIPPLMGWAAANARGTLDPGAYVLAGALYLWQMPHFMALAYMGKDDYLNGGYRMLSHPMYDKTGRRLAGVAVRNAVALLPIGVVAVAMGVTSSPFAYETLALGTPMVAASMAFYAKPSIVAARRMFFGSLLYLPAFQVLACLHRIPRDQSVDVYESLRQTSAAFPWHCVPFAAANDWSPERERLRAFRSRALGPALSETSYAPFPFLPLPIPSCPHDRAYAQGKD